MAKMKLTLAPLPDFKLPVTLTMPNGDEATVVFTVMHRKASEIQDLYASEEPVSDIALITNLAKGWDLEEEFSDENIAQLLDLFPSVSIALTGAYMQALAGQRVKN